MPSAFILPTPLATSNTRRTVIQPHHDFIPVCSAIQTSKIHVSTPQPSNAPLHRLLNHIVNLRNALITFERQTRPGLPHDAAHPHSIRYASLPPHVQTPSQMLGRLSPGCEGTKGVFPKCNFGCKPCYHSAEANRVRVDGHHTLTEVARQMATLRAVRGDTGHCQLIGGEVSLLEPEDHAMALEVMRFYGRIPMSFSHGDFDYQYLKRLALKDGVRRFDRIDFAVHFDSGMRGRTGVPLQHNELDLTPFRQRFINMFQKLKAEYGVNYYIAHNMTVTENNLSHVAQAVEDMRTMGFRLLSFQPAAKQGNQNRWVVNLREVDDDDGEMVWKEIEKGMGMRLSYSLFQMGDVRCNRMTVCGILGPPGRKDAKIFLLFDDLCNEDVKVRDIIIHKFGNIVLKPKLLTFKFIRTLLSMPWLLIPAIAWVIRVVRRAGGIWCILRYGVRPLTIVMHRFMDAEDVNKAWELIENGIARDDPRVDEAGSRVRETMERLSACSYAMAHPESGRVVPACVQHSFYDPQENIELSKKLPLHQPARSATPEIVEKARVAAKRGAQSCHNLDEEVTEEWEIRAI